MTEGFRPYCVKCGLEVDLDAGGSAWADDDGLYYGLHTKCRIRDEQDPVLALIGPPQSTLGPAVLTPFERDLCNVDSPDATARECIFRGHVTIAPRARWHGQEYSYLGSPDEFLAYDEEEHGAVLCDDRGRVTVVAGDPESGGVERQCPKCGRWSEDVQAGYGPGDTLVWECPEYCGWQADMDSGRWSK